MVNVVLIGSALLLLLRLVLVRLFLVVALFLVGLVRGVVRLLVVALLVRLLVVGLVGLVVVRLLGGGERGLRGVVLVRQVLVEQLAAAVAALVALGEGLEHVL